jgi:8-oxo-dGTP pyrophosphatase MutT (NUDIX family)
LEDGESVIQAVVREAAEEIGVTVPPDALHSSCTGQPAVEQ